MNFILNAVTGAVSGALAGGALGCFVSWTLVSAAYTGWRTFWPDCGPHIFIPLWIGTVIGLVAGVDRDSPSGAVTTIIAGAVAGFVTPTIFWMAFGQNLHFHFGFLALPILRGIIIGICGGAAGLFWYMGINRFFR
jgi:uncharacterized membrane protein YeaQ/YmgE (transglycosylase-associated protein family)